jgi:hypothetical protein
MQAPLVVFDHTKKTVVRVETGPAGDKKLAEVLDVQRSQVATSGRPSS